MAFNRAQLLVAFVLGLLLMCHGAEAFHQLFSSMNKDYNHGCMDWKECMKSCQKGGFDGGFCILSKCTCFKKGMHAPPPQHNAPELAPSEGPSEAKAMFARKVYMGTGN
ncbi:hypothetical protein CFC21_049653 [Triticum aestivum]|uniref:Knottin scorpion toxin-like domain-containing protein n=2 Tax=Triticinae TaxID=1648030 RepID=A0A9R1G2D8_WHEAT|nr:uncharacterized protein LOC123075372 [Triticum aestivum]XP_045090390.1 uncharacterized protein LOC120976214 isoform X1 [Aegilops tauschii subsp. strangulata]XP_045090391.1 uncharacterized protein LOC120976215 isoform X1 [Aegilops tauschii subsp. strangulata]KAF7039702.1 hypothetical protein CFC21_049652 [Triticum aestivum]KAF7039703.1 hypothetical protein CFC21_049653 [Triticum aestivum]